MGAAISHPDRRAIAGYVESQEESPDLDSLFATIPDLRRKYWQALRALHRELVPNHIDAQHLYADLWKLFKQVALNASAYQTRENLDKKLSDFCELVKRPLQAFDIIYEVRNLDIGDSAFNLGDVEVFKLTSDYLDGLGISVGSLLRDTKVKEWLGRSVAKVEVNVSDIDRAYASGFSMVDGVLNVMRLAAVWERLSSLDDGMFLWELGESIVIPRSKPPNGTLPSVSSYHGRRPLVVPMNDTLQIGFGNESIWYYLLDATLPGDVKSRVLRSTKWISHAVTSSSFDDKLVYLCTALEVLLLPNRKEGLKGELIALRQVLIGRGTSYVPEVIWYLYEKRSNIVHSGTLEITSYSDYWHLLICCLRVLRNIVSLSEENPGIGTLEGLIGVVETTETLQEFIRGCESGIYRGKGIGHIRKAAEKRLAEIEKGR